MNYLIAHPPTTNTPTHTHTAPRNDNQGYFPPFQFHPRCAPLAKGWCVNVCPHLPHEFMCNKARKMNESICRIRNVCRCVHIAEFIWGCCNSSGVHCVVKEFCQVVMDKLQLVYICSLWGCQVLCCVLCTSLQGLRDFLNVPYQLCKFVLVRHYLCCHFKNMNLLNQNTIHPTPFPGWILFPFNLFSQARLKLFIIFNKRPVNIHFNFIWLSPYKKVNFLFIN